MKQAPSQRLSQVQSSLSTSLSSLAISTPGTTQQTGCFSFPSPGRAVGDLPPGRERHSRDGALAWPSGSASTRAAPPPALPASPLPLRPGALRQGDAQEVQQTAASILPTGVVTWEAS